MLVIFVLIDYSDTAFSLNLLEPEQLNELLDVMTSVMRNLSQKLAILALKPIQIIQANIQVGLGAPRSHQLNPLTMDTHQ